MQIIDAWDYSSWGCFYHGRGLVRYNLNTFLAKYDQPFPALLMLIILAIQKCVFHSLCHLVWLWLCSLLDCVRPVQLYRIFVNRFMKWNSTATTKLLSTASPAFLLCYLCIAWAVESSLHRGFLLLLFFSFLVVAVVIIVWNPNWLQLPSFVIPKGMSILYSNHRCWEEHFI